MSRPQLSPAAAARHERRGRQRARACDRHRTAGSTRPSCASAATPPISRAGRASSPRTKHSPEAVCADDRRRSGDGARRRAALRQGRQRAAIYYGLGVTEHSQGSTTVMAHRQSRDGDRQHRPRGRRREPAARPEQRAGLLRHGLVPARILRLSPRLRRRDARHLRDACGTRRSSTEPGLRIPNMMDEAVDGDFKGLYVQGEDIAQSDPDTQHITGGLKAMECVIVQDLFLNETARYAHVFFPGASFLEKDGTFTNAERRINRVRKAIEPLAGKARLGGDARLRPRARLADGLQASAARSWTRSPRRRRPSAASPTPSSTSSARCNGRATTRRRRARRSCTSTASCAARASSC